MSKIVGMSRNINADYLNEVGRLYILGKSEVEIRDCLNEYLYQFIKDKTNLNKTRSILMNIWVNEMDESNDAKKMATDLFKTDKLENKLLSNWCLMNFAYPVFSDVCKVIGKLEDNFDTISTRNVKNRMIEIWGERTTLIYSVDKIVKTLKDIDVLSVRPKNVYDINKYNVVDINGLTLIAYTILFLRDKLYVSLDELNECYEFFPFQYHITLETLEQSKLFLIDKFGGEYVVSTKKEV